MPPPHARDVRRRFDLMITASAVDESDYMKMMPFCDAPRLGMSPLRLDSATTSI